MISDEIVIHHLSMSIGLLAAGPEPASPLAVPDVGMVRLGQNLYIPTNVSGLFVSNSC
jgi:hypothetical protein